MKQLDPQILRPLLARRRATFPPRSYVAAAAIREREFSEVSLSYREHHPTLESDVIVEVEDVALCVPSKFALKVKIPWKIIQMTRKLTVGGIMLDVGANIGQTSVPRVLLGDFVAIYAAEPDPDNYARLRSTIEANGTRGFVLPDRVAIGSRDGVLRFHQGHYRSHRAAADSEANALEVPCLTLDSWVERLQIDLDTISFVKVDTNGFEIDVLRGAHRVLERGLAVWQIEVAPAFMAQIGAHVEILWDEIQRHFTHFIDLQNNEVSERVRSTSELSEACPYLAKTEPSKGIKLPQTDLLCFNN